MTTSITARELNEAGVRYYDVYIYDKKIITTVTSYAKHVRDWIREVQFNSSHDPLRLIVGIDIKFGAHPLRPVALLLLFSLRSCLIFHLAYATDIPRALPRFFRNSNHTFVGVGIESKLLRFRQEYGTGGRAWAHDLATLTAARYKRPDLKSVGVGQLRTFLHGKDLERPAVVDIWNQEQLSNEHVHHACIDAYTCYELGSYLVYPVGKGTADD